MWRWWYRGFVCGAGSAIVGFGLIDGLLPMDEVIRRIAIGVGFALVIEAGEWLPKHVRLT